jgi:hypothetical protein
MSTYEYEYCAYLVNLADGTTSCRDYALAEVEVAPLVPPFSYNNLCSSVLLTSFIPVFILVCALQLLLPLVQVCLFASSKYTHFPKPLRKVLFGIFWPEYWRKDNSSSVVSGAVDEKEPSELAEPLLLLKASRIISTDILNPLLVLCTFGICSPFLALIMLVSVSLKHYMWVLFLGRFVHTRITATMASFGATNRNTEVDTSSMSVQHRQVGEDHALVALSAACVPILDIVTRCVWPVIWSSSLFFAFLCWDVLSDEVGWRKALWAPVGVLCLPVCLWVCLGVVSPHYGNTSRGRGRGRGDRPSVAASSTSTTSYTGSEDGQCVDSNPLHNVLKMTEMRSSIA